MRSGVLRHLPGLVATSIILAADATVSLAQSSVSYPTSTPIANNTPTDWGNTTPLTLDFEQFNPSLGTLNSVELDLSVSASTFITIVNRSEFSSTGGTASTVLDVNVQDSGDNLASPFDVLRQAFTFGGGIGGTGVGIGATLRSGPMPLTASGSSDITYTSPAILGEFTGNGTYDLQASTFTLTEMIYGNGNVSVTQTTDAGLTGEVIYFYTAIPEPATFGLMIL